jgi:dolichol-phosphate mannosyltransferase
MSNPTYSVIIPIYNEQEIIPELYHRLTKTLTALESDYEIICVDDGSQDRSYAMIKELSESDSHIKLLSFSRNFGHQAAVTAGLNFATGEAVIVMDGDLQDPPELIPQLAEKWRNGYDVVYAIRKARKEGFFKKACYKAFYRVLSAMSEIDIPLDSGDFCLMSKKVVVRLNQLPERNRFIRGLRSWVGFAQIGIEYERDKRFAGKEKYTFRKLMTLALDGIFSFSKMPLRMASILGFSISIVSFLFIFQTLIEKLFFDISPQGWTSTVIIISFFGGIQLIMIGLVGEYLVRIYDEVKQRPVYILKDMIGFK